MIIISGTPIQPNQQYAQAEASKIIGDLRRVKSAVQLASNDKKPVEFGEFENGELPEAYSMYMDEPIGSKYVKKTIISADSLTEQVFVGFSLSFTKKIKDELIPVYLSKVQFFKDLGRNKYRPNERLQDGVMFMQVFEMIP
jgi:hypothetical protein